VNHWPSRSGGQEVSEPNRIFAAEKLKARVDDVMKSNPMASIVIVGDFNDHPDNTSISKTLGAGADSKSTLFNFMWDDHANKSGSYNYKGEWGALDQFIINSAMLDANAGWSCHQTDAVIYRGKFLLYTDKDGQSKPNRTYAGDKYVGGYSDHLPVLLTLRWK
jgi:predicted extracellular nuclease